MICKECLSVVITKAKDYLHEVTINSVDNLSLFDQKWVILHSRLKNLFDKLNVKSLLLSLISPDLWRLRIKTFDNRFWRQDIDTTDRVNSYNTFTTDSFSEAEINEKRIFRKELLKFSLYYNVTSLVVVVF